MRHKNKTRLQILFLLFTLFLFACSEQGHFKKLNNYITNLKQIVAKKKKKNENDTFKVPAPFVYGADSLRAPFESNESGTKNPNASNPLQVYSLNMLRFMGTVTKDTVSIAYVMAPDNKLYRVKVGDIIGDHKGKVINIDSDKMEVMEIEQETGSPPKQRIVTLQLKEEP